MFTKGRILLLIFCILLTVSRIGAQYNSSEGKSFFVTFIPSLITPTCDVTLSSRTGATVTIENSAKGYSSSLNLTANTPVTVTIPTSACLPSTGASVDNYAVHITSSHNISVYAMNYAAAIADGALIYPEAVCGNRYYTSAYEGLNNSAPSSFLIVGLSNNQQIRITPKVDLASGKPAGVPYTVTLNRGQTYLEYGKNTLDITGSLIEDLSGKPFALYSGTKCVNIPTTACPACDVLMEQMVPLTALGKKYLLAPLSTATVTPAYTYRIIGTRDNTYININGARVDTLNKGETLHKTNESNAICVDATEPIMVVQYTQGITCVQVGDPAMVVIPPVEQIIDRVNYATPGYTGFNKHYVYILLKTAAKHNVMINGTPVSASKFSAFTSCNLYSYANIELSGGNHLVECDSGFTMIAYGYGQAISYAYIGGTNFANLSFDAKINNHTCDNLAFTMQNTGDTAEILKSYWDFGDGTKDSGKFVSKTYFAHGTYTVKNTLHIGGVFPRVDTLSKTFKTKQSPKAGFTITATTECLKNNLYQFTDTSKYFGGSSVDESVWTYTDMASLPKRNLLYIYRRHTSSGLKGVMLKITTDQGCSDSVISTYTIKPDAKSAFTLGGDQCFKTNRLQPLPQSTIDTPATISGYSWAFGDGTSDTASAPYKVYTDTGTYTVTLVTIADNGCHDTANNSFTVNPSPNVGIITASVCEGDTVKIKNITTIAKGTLTYKWWYGDGHTDTLVEKNRLYSDTGVKVLKLVATSEMFCKDSLTQQVRVIPAPIADFAVNTFCEDRTGTFTDISNRYGETAQINRWYFGDGAEQLNTGNTQHLYTDTGWYKVKLYTKSVNGCYDTVEKRLYINSHPLVSFYSNDTVQCLSQNYYTFSESVVMKRGSIASFQWKFNDTFAGTGPFWGGNLATQGTYNVKMIAVTDSGCVDSASKQVIIWPQATLATTANDSSQCLGGNVFTLTNNSSISQGALSYLWKFSSGQTYATTNPPPISFAVPGTYLAWLVSTSDKGCKDSVLTKLYVEFNPEVDFVTQSICENDTAYFVNTTAGDASGWQWDFGDGGISTLKEPIHSYNSPGIYKVTLMGRSANGCGDTISKDSGVIVNPAPKVYFTTEIGDNVSGNTSVNFINKTLFGDNFSWAFSNGSFSRAKNPTESFKDTGYIRVILSAINNFNCFDEFDTVIYISPDFNIDIPNAFTPNKDPMNPVFKVEGTYYCKEFEFWIFDRWGKLLFYTMNPYQGWNGEYEETPLPTGVYVYRIRMIDYKGKIRAYSGNVHLLR